MTPDPIRDIRPALYRVDEVMVILSCSRGTVYNLLEEGKLRGHNDKPGCVGMRITVKSVKEYLEKYELPFDSILELDIKPAKNTRKIISKGVE